MCKLGGFNITKFIFNSHELLQSIPEQQRPQGTKNQDLSSDLPTDKALGICWNIADDTSSFEIKLNRSLTKRAMFSMISSIYDPLGFAAPFVLEGRRILRSLSNQNLPWDIEVNDDVKKEWNKFITRLKHVDELYMLEDASDQVTFGRFQMSVYNFLMHQRRAMDSAVISR